MRSRWWTTSLVVALVLGLPFLAASAPPPGFVLQETITVPVDGTSVTSATTLQSGVTYKIRASGTFTIGGPGFGDAEYAFDASNSSVTSVGDSVDLGIGINDTINDNPKAPFWGNFTSTHEYTIDFLGAGSTIALNYHDSFYDDNEGSLTVEIFAPAQEVPTLTEWALVLLLAVLVGSGLWGLRRRAAA
jgi:hypothetical protein